MLQGEKLQLIGIGTFTMADDCMYWVLMSTIDWITVPYCPLMSVLIKDLNKQDQELDWLMPAYLERILACAKKSITIRPTSCFLLNS